MAKTTQKYAKKIQSWQKKNNYVGVKEAKVCGTCGHKTFEGFRCWCLTLKKECGVSNSDYIKYDDAEVSFFGSCDRWIKEVPFARPEP